MDEREWANDMYENQDPQRKYANEQPNYVPNYQLDSRNLRHGIIHWTACTKDTCTGHYQAKVDANYFPPARARCRWEWFDCNLDLCDEHLWDKRTRSYFPTMDDAQNAATSLLINNVCTQNHWQTCMHPLCFKHREEKEKQGFAYVTHRTAPRAPRHRFPSSRVKATFRYRAPESEYTPEELASDLRTTLRYKAPEEVGEPTKTFLGQHSEGKTPSEN
jgi:hypothetical protein